MNGWYEWLAEAARRCRRNERMWAHFLRGLAPQVRRAIDQDWGWQGHEGQWEPGGEWRCWLLMAGRGFGKTRAGAEWVHARANRPSPDPSLNGRGEAVRIALVAETREEAVRVMVEGPSGLLATARGFRPRWSRTHARIDWPGGAQAFVYSAEAAEALRGPEHDAAWCDELAKWGSSGAAAWDNLMMGLRRGERPRVMVTTTPRPGALIKRIIAAEDTAVTGGRTADNMHLPDAFVAAMKAAYGGTRLGAQELDGQLIEAVEGSLFPVEMMEKARVSSLTLPPLRGGPLPLPQGEREFKRVVVGVDPPASAEGDACGIVVCASLDRDPPTFVVLADHSVSGQRPEGWAKAVARAAEVWGADRVVAEKNQGGEMVAAVLRAADCLMPVRLVHASRGKAARAEPVAALMEAGRIKLAGRFPELEAELNGLTAGGDYQGPTRSPDRADACVWALSALIEGARRGGPRVLAL